MRLSSRYHQHHRSLFLPLVGPYGHRYVQMSPHSYSEPSDFSPTLVICTPLCKNVYRNGPHFIASRKHKYGLGTFGLPQHHLLFIALQLSAAPLLLSMITHKKNKSAHPGIPDMTPSQLSSASLSCTSNTRRSSGTSTKKPTKDQQIAALKDELRAVRELISSVSPLYLTIHVTTRSPPFIL